MHSTTLLASGTTSDKCYCEVRILDVGSRRRTIKMRDRMMKSDPASWLPYAIRMACALTVATIVILYSIASPRFSANDDFAIICELSGKDGFPANAHCSFISKTLAEILYLLYSLLPTVPWYGLALIASQAMACIAWYLPLFRRNWSSFERLCLAVPCLIFLSLSLMSVTFTATTLWVVFGGALLFGTMFGGNSRDDTRRDARLTMFFCAACLLIGGLWRIHLALVGIAITGPALVLAGVEINRINLRRAVFVLLPVCVFAVTDLMWSKISETSADRDVQEFQQLRGVFHDYTPQLSERGLKAAEWSLADYQIFHDFWMLYDSRFNTKTLKKYLAESPSNVEAIGPGLPETILIRMKAAWRTCWREVPVFLLSVLSILLSTWQRRASGVLKDQNRPWKSVLDVLALFALLAVVGSLVAYRFVWRIYAPVFLLITGSIALRAMRDGSDVGVSENTLGRSFRTQARQLATFLCAVLLLGFGVSLTWFQRGFYTHAAVGPEILEATTKFLASNSSPESAIFVPLCPIYGFSLETCSPLD